jgi:hypothetical protein
MATFMLKQGRKHGFINCEGHDPRIADTAHKWANETGQPVEVYQYAKYLGDKAATYHLINTIEVLS